MLMYTFVSTGLVFRPAQRAVILDVVIIFLAKNREFYFHCYGMNVHEQTENFNDLFVIRIF